LPAEGGQKESIETAVGSYPGEDVPSPDEDVPITEEAKPSKSKDMKPAAKEVVKSTDAEKPKEKPKRERKGTAEAKKSDKKGKETKS
jgi:hypothetical protein